MPKNTMRNWSNSQESGNLTVALKLARSGLPVFPCKPDKSPLTTNGFKAATTDEKQIERWWSKHPDAMPGLPTGAASGVAVLDIDRKGDKDGFKALKRAGLHKTAMAPYVVDMADDDGKLSEAEWRASANEDRSISAADNAESRAKATKRALEILSRVGRISVTDGTICIQASSLPEIDFPDLEAEE
jgi:hypothetical protein